MVLALLAIQTCLRVYEELKVDEARLLRLHFPSDLSPRQPALILGVLFGEAVLQNLPRAYQLCGRSKSEDCRFSAKESCFLVRFSIDATAWCFSLDATAASFSLDATASCFSLDATAASPPMPPPVFPPLPPPALSPQVLTPLAVAQAKQSGGGIRVGYGAEASSSTHPSCWWIPRPPDVPPGVNCHSLPAMHENGPADSGFCCFLEGAFGHRAEFRVSNARLGKLVFGTPDKSGLPGAGSLVYIFICVAGVSEKEKHFKGPAALQEKSEKKKICPKVSTFSFERRSRRRVDLSMRELRELIELRELCRSAGSLVTVSDERAIACWPRRKVGGRSRHFFALPSSCLLFAAGSVKARHLAGSRRPQLLLTLSAAWLPKKLGRPRVFRVEIIPTLRPKVYN